MDNLLKKERNKTIGQSIVLALLGLLIVLFPAYAASVYSTIIGVGLIVFGVLAFIFFFVTIAAFEPRFLVEGILFILFGSLILYNPDTFFIVSICLLAIQLLIEGITEITYSVQMKKLHIKFWWIDLIYGIIITILGVLAVILNFTMDTADTVLIVVEIIGAATIFEALMRIILVCVVHHNYKEVKESFKKDVVSNQ